jgi:response regulator RpfG family c-di-GMP phosphodiesterase
LQPDLKVLYISGYDNTHVVQKYVVERGHLLLSKPFTMEELKGKMSQLLRATAQTAH